jgi:hypothetical protein
VQGEIISPALASYLTLKKLLFSTFQLWFNSKCRESESISASLDPASIKNPPEKDLITEQTGEVRGASKIKLKNVNKKRMATARRLIFWNFSRHPLLIWLHCCFHHYKTLKAVAMATVAIVVLTPVNFHHFQRPKFNFQPLSFTFETFGKKLAETKIVARVNGKKIKSKK